MSVLKIKDQNNDWIQIPTIKGEKGDPFTYADFTPEQLESLKGKDGISPTVSVASDTSDDYRLSFTDETHTVTTPNLIPEAEKILSVYPHDTASGAVASFSDGADDIPLKSCIVQVEPVQEGSGDPSPDNVRPISGWTGVEVQRTGENLLDTTEWEEDSYIGADGATGHENGQHYSVNYSPIKTGVYDIAIPRASTSSRVRIHGYDKDKQWVKQVFAEALNPGTDVYHTQITIDAGIKYIRISIRSAITDVQLKLGSTATAYEPYTGQTYPITFPAEAGTVYGAYVDVLTGKLTLTHYFCTPDNAKRITYGIDAQSNLPYAFFSFTQSGSAIALSPRTLCSMYKAGTASRVDKALRMWTSEADIWDSDLDVTSLDTVKAYFADLIIVYPIATPIEIQLDTHTIKTLLGQNNIWSDTGDTEVTYRADTTLYISRLTEPDTDMVADSNIVSGQYFMVGNDLYKATVNIASGASVIVGTNATKVSLAQALNEINA